MIASPASRVRVQVWKELRALLPWWAGAMFAVMVCERIVLPQHVNPSGRVFLMAALFSYVAGCAGLGALSIGQEYSHRTLGSLLAQPVHRSTLLSVKFGVLALLLGALLAAAWQLGSGASPLFPSSAGRVPFLIAIVGPALAGLFLAPWLTMLCRGPLAGGVFSIAIPILGMLAAGTFPFRLGLLACWTICVALFALGAVMTWVTFLRVPVIEGPGRALQLPSWLRRPMAVDHSSESQVHWLRAAIAKELRLQQLTFITAVLYVAAWLVIAIARQVEPDFTQVFPSYYGLTYLYIGLTSLMAGALPVAEERQYGSADWHLLLPVASWKQWAVKSGLAIGLSLALALGLPMLLHAVHPATDDVAIESEGALAVSLLAISGLFVSSLSSTGLRALLACLPIVAAAMLSAGMFLAPLNRLAYEAARPIADGWIHPGFGLPRAMLQRIVLPLTLVGFGWLALWFGLANFRTIERTARRITRQFVWLAIYASMTMILAGVLQAVVGAAARIPR